MQAKQKISTVVPPSQQRLHTLRFLQKLGHQKPCWDQARLSRLVNKQVVVQGARCSEQGTRGRVRSKEQSDLGGRWAVRWQEHTQEHPLGQGASVSRSPPANIALSLSVSFWVSVFLPLSLVLSLSSAHLILCRKVAVTATWTVGYQFATFAWKSVGLQKWTAYSFSLNWPLGRFSL